MYVYIYICFNYIYMRVCVYCFNTKRCVKITLVVADSIFVSLVVSCGG